MSLFWTSFVVLVVCTTGFNIDTQRATIYKGNTGSYFGYSVALLNNTDGCRVIVGAPKDNDTDIPDVVRPGALYQCPFPQTTNCSHVVVDPNGNSQQTVRFHGRNVTFHNEKTDQWLGVSLDVHNEYMDSVLVCAHRWRDSYTYRKVSDILHMNGICYQLNASLSEYGRPVPALTRLDRLVNRRMRYAEFSMGTLGVSAMFSADGSKLLIGAPGLNDWSGGLVIESESSLRSDMMYIEPPWKLYRDSYTGYAMATGRFISRSLYSVALGAPTGHGKVLFYDISYARNLPELTIEGEQIGSYFGSSLCAVDINGDAWDDILVGAPLFSMGSGKEQGAVYVYRTKGAMGFDELQVLRGSTNSWARFGTALINLGDINDDQFQDIAVGAPFEDDYRGVVYVYNGYRSGLWPYATQKISARNISPNLQSFGATFSRTFDIDGNGYNDFAVGAHTSDRVVLLRTRPLIDIMADVAFSPRRIEQVVECHVTGIRMPCTRLTLCFMYSSSRTSVPDNMDLTFTLKFDVGRKQRQSRAVVFQSSDGGSLQEVTSVSDSVNLAKNVMNCTMQYIAYIRSDIDNKEPVEVLLTYTERYVDHCDLCPLPKTTDQDKRVSQSNNTKSFMLEFARECGAACYCDLRIENQTVICGSHKEYCVMGEQYNFAIMTDIKNVGDIAYDTVLIFTVPSTLHYLRGLTTWNGTTSSMECETSTSGSKTEVTCNIGDVIENSGKGEIVVEFYVTHERNYSSIFLETNLYTSSRETDIYNNHKDKHVAIKLQPTLQFYGYSAPDQVLVERSTNELERITHSFEIHNDGPSTLEFCSVSMSFPLIPRSVYLTNYNITTSNDHKNKIECNMHPITRRPLPATSPLQTTLLVSCRSYTCLTLTCHVSGLSRQDKATVHLYFVLNRKFLTEYQNVRYIQLESNASLTHADDDRLDIPSRYLEAKAVTDVCPGRQKINRDEFYMWVVVISLCSGVILIFAVSLILRKYNFFRRKYKEKLRCMKTARRCMIDNLQSGEEGQEDQNNVEGEGSNENLVITEYITVLSNPTTPTDHSPDTLNNFVDGDDYLEPIQTLLK